MHRVCPLLLFLTFDRSNVPEERREESETGRFGVRQPADAWVFLSRSTRISLMLSYRRKQGASPVQEDHKARFYEDYRKVAEEYDKEFLKKYDEDLNTTLIFVSSASSFVEYLLTEASGRSVFRCRLRFHHPSRLSTPTRLE